MEVALREAVGDVRRSVADDQHVLHDDRDPERGDEDRDGAAPPELLDEPEVQRQPGGRPGRRGDHGGGRDVLMEDRLPRVGGVGAEGEELAVGEVRDPADRVLQRERDRGQRQDRRRGEPNADGHEESGHVVPRRVGLE